MQENNSFPILYVKDNEPDDSQNNKTILCEMTNKESTASGEIKNKRNIKAKYFNSHFVFSVFLGMVAIFVISLSLFSSNNGVLDPDRIISYIAEDFLGIDIKNGSIFDYWISEDPLNNNDSIQTPPSINDEAGTDEDSQQTEDTSVVTDSEIILPPPTDIILPDGEHPIVEIDLSSDEINITNMTSYDISINDYKEKEKLNSPYILTINPDMTLEPLVLIIHTHGTEAYSAEGSASYSDSYNVPRSTNTDENVVSIGKKIASVMNENGVPTLHCEIMHDKESYQNSYERASQTIAKYLKRYPSIKYVFDIHRDSIVNDANVKFKPVTNINGQKTAQIMFVMGSNENSPTHKLWESNLTFAIKLTDKLNKNHTAFTRPISLRGSSYNQEYTPGSILVEIGSCGNTLQEAKNAGVIFAEEVSKIILEGW